MYYYDLVDVMSERALAHPKVSTDTMNMRGTDDDADDSSSSSISVTGKDEEEDEDVSAAEKLAEAEKEREQKDDNADDDGYPTGSFPAISTTSSPIGGAMAITAINSSGISTVTLSLNAKNVAVGEKEGEDSKEFKEEGKKDEQKGWEQELPWKLYEPSQY
jgi:hypothetical protein